MKEIKLFTNDLMALTLTENTVFEQDIKLLLNSLKIIISLEYTFNNYSSESVDVGIASLLLVGNQLLGANLEKLSKNFTAKYPILSEVCFSEVQGRKSKSWYGHDRFAIAHALEPNILFHDNKGLFIQSQEQFDHLKQTLLNVLIESKAFDKNNLDNLAYSFKDDRKCFNIPPVKFITLPKLNQSYGAQNLINLLYLDQIVEDFTTKVSFAQYETSEAAQAYGSLLIQMIGNNVKEFHQKCRMSDLNTTKDWYSFIKLRNKLAHTETFEEIFENEDQIFPLLQNVIHHKKTFSKILNELLPKDEFNKVLQSLSPQKQLKKASVKKQEKQPIRDITHNRKKIEVKNINVLTPEEEEKIIEKFFDNSLLIEKEFYRIRALSAASKSRVILGIIMLLFRDSTYDDNIGFLLHWFFLQFDLNPNSIVTKAPQNFNTSKIKVAEFYPIEQAYTAKNMVTLKGLILYGANVNICINNYPFLLFIASSEFKERFDIIKVAFANGADPNIRSPDGKHILFLFLEFTVDSSIITQFIQNGADASLSCVTEDEYSVFEAIILNSSDLLPILVSNYYQIQGAQYIVKALKNFLKPDSKISRHCNYDGKESAKSADQARQICLICQDETLILHHLVLKQDLEQINQFYSQRSPQERVNMSKINSNSQGTFYTPLALAKELGLNEIAKVIQENVRKDLMTIIAESKATTIPNSSPLTISQSFNPNKVTR